MTIPAFIFGLLVAAAYACIYHLIIGENVFTLFIYILVSAAGFFLGNWLGWLIGKEILVIGVFSFGWATLISFMFLAVAGLLSHPLF